MKGENNMPIDEEEMKKLKAENEKLKKELEKMGKKFTDLEENFKKSVEEKEKAKKDFSDLQFETRKKDIVSKVDNLIESKKLLPAQKDFAVNALLNEAKTYSVRIDSVACYHR